MVNMSFIGEKETKQSVINLFDKLVINVIKVYCAFLESVKIQAPMVLLQRFSYDMDFK